jgi:hypothetical protein
MWVYVCMRACILSSAKDKKREIFPVHAVKVYKGIRNIAPLFINFDTKWRSVANFTPDLCIPGIGARCLFSRRLGEPQRLSGPSTSFPKIWEQLKIPGSHNGETKQVPY